MAKRITIKQLTRAFEKFPKKVKIEGKLYLVRGLREYKKVAFQSSPWRVGQSGGGVPVKTGNLKEQHRTKIKDLEGRFGVSDKRVKYAPYVHKYRPWLDYAKNKADKSVEKHYKVFMDNILNFIAT